MRYKVALIGCGRIGSLLEEDPLRRKPASHMGGILTLAPRVKSVVVCDIDEERLARCKEKWNPAGTYTNYKRLLKVEKPDIVVIATWTSSHMEIALRAASSGVKGIVLEKPVAVDPGQARKVIDICREKNIPLVINHERRWEPLYRKTAEIIASGELGALKMIYGNVLCRSAARGSWKNILKEVGGGPLLHDGTHLVDMIRYFAGDIASLSGSVKREHPEAGVETSAAAMMKTVGGVDVFIEAGGMREYFNFELDLQLERGRLRVGNGYREYWVAEPSKRYSGFSDLVKKEFPTFVRDCDPFSGGLNEVMTALETGLPPISSGEDGYKAMEVIFGIYHSALHGGKRVELPLNIRGNPLKRMFQKGLL
ncbi:MAG: Gfo/Idh/MocA family oxidoreductase [bacterium]|nr:Gfo/Idh/MocA family oxidoreductase [bacterium]